MSEKLKPCPHCGSVCVSMTSEVVEHEGERHVFYFVHCQNAYCGVAESETEKEAANWWNSRK